MSQSASSRPRTVFLVLFALAVVAVVAFAVWRMTGDDDTEPRATTTTESSSSTAPDDDETSSEPTPTPTSTASCEGPDTLFNEEGVRQESLLPDCGTSAVSEQERKKSGLTLACGGKYPVILYKTTTTGAKTSICGEDASGESFRFVIKPGDGEVLDMPGSYDPQLDAFVARKGGVTYAVEAYNGSLLVRKDGQTTRQEATDWISLDNESDYD